MLGHLVYNRVGRWDEGATRADAHGGWLRRLLTALFGRH